MTPASQHAKQILTVEAEVPPSDDVVDGLRGEGHSVRRARDEREALELLRQGPVDLLLLDAACAGPIGVLRRHHLALTGTPLVVLGPADPAEVEADAYLPRPVQPERLLAVVRRYLARPRPVILVVEDDLSVQRMFRIALETAGFIVWQAAAGQAALDLVRQHGDRIALLLLDVQLIGPLDGPQTLAAVRQLRPHVPCCFMSGYSGPYTTEQLLALGAAHVFAKPFPSLAEVVRLLWKLVPPPPDV